MGHGEVVTLPVCVVCGRTGRLPSRTKEGDRCCTYCYTRLNPQPCARCAVVRPIAARRPEGGICRSCQATDAHYLRQCADCGRMRAPHTRRADGGILCQTCAQRPPSVCCRCGQVRPVHARSDDGPVCRACYQGSRRHCGLCGEIAPIALRATAERPETCQRCYRNKKECLRTRPRRQETAQRRLPLHQLSPPDDAYLRTLRPPPADHVELAPRLGMHSLLRPPHPQPARLPELRHHAGSGRPRQRRIPSLRPLRRFRTEAAAHHQHENP